MRESTAIIKFGFQGDELHVVSLPDGDVGVVLRRLAETVGLDADAQSKRLAHLASQGLKWACTSVTEVQVGGQGRNVLVLPRRSIPMWAATVDLSRVSEVARAKLVAYQDRCADVLAEEFLGIGKVEASEPLFVDERPSARGMIVDELRRAIDRGDQKEAGKLHAALGVLIDAAPPAAPIFKLAQTSKPLRGTTAAATAVPRPVASSCVPSNEESKEEVRIRTELPPRELSKPGPKPSGYRADVERKILTYVATQNAGGGLPTKKDIRMAIGAGAWITEDVLRALLVRGDLINEGNGLCWALAVSTEVRAMMAIQGAHNPSNEEARRQEIVERRREAGRIGGLRRGEALRARPTPEPDEAMKEKILDLIGHDNEHGLLPSRRRIARTFYGQVSTAYQTIDAMIASGAIVNEGSDKTGRLRLPKA